MKFNKTQTNRLLGYVKREVMKYPCNCFTTKKMYGLKYENVYRYPKTSEVAKHITFTTYSKKGRYGSGVTFNCNNCTQTFNVQLNKKEIQYIVN